MWLQQFYFEVEVLDFADVSPQAGIGYYFDGDASIQYAQGPNFVSFISSSTQSILQLLRL